MQIGQQTPCTKWKTGTRNQPKSESQAPNWSFEPKKSVEQVEEGNDLAPKFNENGTLPCITQHADTGEILLFAYMNEEALRLTIDKKLAHYWSRSRQKLWLKGETSGMYQQVQQVLIDDDQDCFTIRVTLTPPSSGGNEASCHVGYRTCFYREVHLAENGPQLQFIEGEKAFNPETVYQGTENPTKL